MSSWTTNDIPDQTGRLVVITGATGGLGYETALALSGKGAEVVLTGRSEAKGAAALAAIRTVFPNAKVSYEMLDLASLKSVADFASRFATAHDQFDLLINNGGVMAVPTRQTTSDGFELQFGTNHLSHFALTGQLLPLLLRAAAPRVVNVSSSAHNMGEMNFDDLQAQSGYRPWAAYGQSKLANLLFTLELQRRSDAQGLPLLAVSAHPGLAATELVGNGMGSGFMARITGVLVGTMGQSAAQGALPQLYAAVAPDVKPAAYYGPLGFMGMRGAPGEGHTAPKGRDAAAASRLWTVSEELTGVTYLEAARAA